MANEFRVKNGLIVDEVSSGAGTITIAEGDISSDATMSIVSTGDATNSIYIRENAGTDGTIKIHADQGTGTDSITILSDAGGIDVDAASAISVESSAGSITIGSTVADGEGVILGKSGATEIQLKPHGTAANEKITITNTAGSANDAVKIAAAAGGLTVDVDGDIRLDADGGDVFVQDGGTTYGSLTNSSGDLHIYSGTTASLKFGTNSANANASFMGDLTVNGTTQTGTAANLFQVSAGNSLDDTVEARLYNSSESPTTISNVGNVLVLDNGNNQFAGAQGVVMTIGSSANTSNNTESWYMGTAANLADCWGIGYADAKHWDSSSFAGSANCVTDVEQWLLRVTSAGKMTIGSPAGQASVDTNPMNKLQVNHTSADGDDGILILRANTTTADDALLGSIGFDSTDGNVPSTNTEAAAYIAAYATEAHGTGDKGGELVFGISRVDDDDDTTSFPIMKVTSDSSTTGWVEIGNGAAGPGELRILEDTDDGSNYVAMRAQAMAANYTMILPAAKGTAGQVLDIASVSGTEITLAWDDAASGGASAMNDLSDVTYSSGDLTISSLDTIISGALVFDSSGDLTLSADGGNVLFDDGSTTIFDFDVDNTHFTIHDDQDTGDYFDISVAQHGATTITTVDDDATAADLTFTIDGDITMSPAGGDFTINSSAASSPVVHITNTHAGATSGELRFNKDSASGADNDVMGMISFYGTDDSDNTHERLAYMDAIITDSAHGSEAASLRFYVAENDATLTQGLAIEGQADNDGEVDVTIGAGSGSTATVAGHLTVTGDLNVTGDVNSVSVTDLDVDDLTITVASGAGSSANADGAGIIVDGAGAQILYDHTGTQWEINKPIEITGGLFPAADDTYDLGSAALAWQDLYLEGDITLSDAGTLSSSAGALTITSAAAATWSTGAGILTLSGDDGVQITSAAAGNIDLDSYADIVLDSADDKHVIFQQAGVEYLAVGQGTVDIANIEDSAGATVVDTWDASVYTAVKYLLIVEDVTNSNQRMAVEMMVMGDDEPTNSAAYYTVYAVLYDAEIGTFSAAGRSSSNLIDLKYTPTATGSTVNHKVRVVAQRVASI